MRNWLEQIWYQEESSGAILRPLSWLFAAVVASRRWLYSRGVLRSHEVGRPVVVVGNLTVGGSGKTPFVLWLVARLSERGVRPGIVLRGYRGKSGQPRVVSGDSSANDVGDEALLLARRGGCPVAIGADRVAAARLLVQQGVDLIVADDGLQHLRLKRDFEIVVIDGVRRFGNGRLLPAGPLREPAERLHSADAVVVNGGSGRAGEIAMRLQPGEAVPVRGGGSPAASRPLKSFAGAAVHAVAAIGYPQRFFGMLQELGIQVIPHAFADHYAFCAADIRFDDGRPVLMTEKDAVKCESFAAGHHWQVPVEACVPQPQAAALLDSVLALLAPAPRG